jgi:hypothetical protein
VSFEIKVFFKVLFFLSIIFFSVVGTHSSMKKIRFWQRISHVHMLYRHCLMCHSWILSEKPSDFVVFDRIMSEIVKSLCLGFRHGIRLLQSVRMIRYTIISNYCNPKHKIPIGFSWDFYRILWGYFDWGSYGAKKWLFS